MSSNSTRPIGIFDSGVGGLTVFRALAERLPGEDFLYLGDTARVPYGNRGAETVRRYALNAASFLSSRNVKALVVACNTASAFALPTLRSRLDIPVFGVIEPVATRGASLSTTGQIAVLGTRGTIRSEAYQKTLLNLRDGLDVYPIACPLLVPLAEEGWTDGAVTEKILAHYLEPLSNTRVDTVILGCTHYPILRNTIAAVADELSEVTPELLDSARSTTEAVAERLAETKLLGDADASGTRKFFLTDLPDGFIATAERFFGRTLEGNCEHVDIEDTT